MTRAERRQHERARRAPRSGGDGDVQARSVVDRADRTVQWRHGPVEKRPVSTAELAAQVRELALRGDAEEAGRLARTALTEVGGAADDEPSGDLAGLWYAIAVTERQRGDDAALVRAADRCLSIARSISSAGWASNALSMRALARVAQGTVDLALTDLARAEVEVAGCGDTVLRGWAHTSLACGYDQLRLYELAQPHLEAALEIESRSRPRSRNLVLNLCNLAELHLRLVEELERVTSVAGGASQVEEQRVLARRWAREALLVAQSLQVPSTIRDCQLLDLRARAEAEPQAVLSGLRAALDDDGLTRSPGERAEFAVALARALRALGRVPEAMAAARIAVDATAGLLDWQVTAGAHYLFIELAAEAAVPGAEMGRAYGRVLSDVLWRQHLQTLQGARSALDVERLQRTTAIATRTAREDPLTGLGNRRALDEALTRLEHSEDGRRDQHSLVLIDIDAFKSINDTHGHLVGDEVLREVARTLRACARRSDLVVRLGGDEFVVLATGATKVQAAALSTRIHQAIERADWARIASGLQVRTSIGFEATGAGSLVTDLVGLADAAMYADKRRHRAVAG
jgi:diguanylate cyclase (GGDEF)-like protein